MSSSSAFCHSRCHANFGSVSSNVDSSFRNTHAQTLAANCVEACDETTSGTTDNACLTVDHLFGTVLPVTQGAVAPAEGVVVTNVTPITFTGAQMLQEYALVQSATTPNAGIAFPTTAAIISAITDACGAAPSDGDSFDLTIGTTPIEEDGPYTILAPVVITPNASQSVVTYGAIAAVPSLARNNRVSIAPVVNFVQLAYYESGGGQKIHMRFTYRAPVYEIRVIERLVVPKYSILSPE